MMWLQTASTVGPSPYSHWSKSLRTEWMSMSGGVAGVSVSAHSFPSASTSRESNANAYR